MLDLIEKVTRVTKLLYEFSLRGRLCILVVEGAIVKYGMVQGGKIKISIIFKIEIKLRYNTFFLGNMYHILDAVHSFTNSILSNATDTNYFCNIFTKH